MARSPRPAYTARDTGGGAETHGNGGDDELSRIGLGGAREWWHQSILAAQGTADLIEQIQRFHVETLHAWAQSLAQADREVTQAGDVGTLMAMPAQWINQQFDLMLRRIGDSTQRLLDADAAGGPR